VVRVAYALIVRGSWCQCDELVGSFHQTFGQCKALSKSLTGPKNDEKEEKEKKKKNEMLENDVT